MPVLFYFVIVRMCCRLTPWIFCRISYTCRLVVTNLLYVQSEEFHYFEELFSIMSEHNCSVMRIVALDQYVTIESSHFFDSEDTDTTKGSCRYV